MSPPLDAAFVGRNPRRAREADSAGIAVRSAGTRVRRIVGTNCRTRVRMRRRHCRARGGRGSTACNRARPRSNPRGDRLKTCLQIKEFVEPGACCAPRRACDRRRSSAVSSNHDL
jgi:hypothetical protein